MYDDAPMRYPALETEGVADVLAQNVEIPLPCYLFHVARIKGPAHYFVDSNSRIDTQTIPKERWKSKREMIAKTS